MMLQQQQQQQSQQQNQQQSEPPTTTVPAAAPAAPAGIPKNDKQGVELIDKVQDEFDDDMETWAADHDDRDNHQFEAEGQDKDDQLQANELDWEHRNFAKSLPPGWAKCPNSGTMVEDMLPIKVCAANAQALLRYLKPCMSSCLSCSVGSVWRG